jgi:adenine-specific DNA-methyltransferase
MGNKHALAGRVADLVGEYAQGRPFLDLFCGMCSVGGAIADSGRPVWGNDVQWSASTVAKCLLTSQDDPVDSEGLATIFQLDYEANLEALRSRFTAAVESERHILEERDLEAFGRERDQWRHVANDPSLLAEAAALSAQPEPPYRLFTLTFAWGYFGLEQAMHIDSLRYAIDRARMRRALSADQARWALVALMQAASCVASTPGHFAQYLSASTREGFRRVVTQRRRSLRDQFWLEADAMRPFGTSDWRAKNRVMRRNALTIWAELRQRGYSRGVVYADPPYSKDHYSRYYHVLDTLVRYDYPPAVGMGRYRPDRFVTPFSLKTRVVEAFDRLARGVAATESVLILSYPSNGLLTACDDGDIAATLGRHFGSVDLVLRQSTIHSTLGARHGSSGNEVEELIYLASPRAAKVVGIG